MSGYSETRKRVLIVDDEKSVRDSLRLLLKSNFEVEIAEDGKQALEELTKFSPDVVLLDLMMPHLDGLETLQEMNDRGVNVPVIMLSAANTVRTAVQAMKYGAVDYLNKPFDVEELTTLIVQTLQTGEGQETLIVEKQATAPVPVQKVSTKVTNIIGTSGAMKEVFRQVNQVATKDTTVLITGESGTGKELIARQIHEKSPRAQGPFVPINCAAIPESLIESELFGHEKGAFTGAHEQRIGHCELANGGTLFLDEIGELSLPVQVKLLRFLQEQEFFRVGSSQSIQVDVRIVAATNKDLEELIREQQFRQDLFYRINVVNITLPSLRDRYEDIPQLIEHFVSELSGVYENRKITFSEDARDSLIRYSWPGNVRELENAVEMLMALCSKDEVTEADLPRKITAPAGGQLFPTGVFEGSMNFEDAERQFETEIVMKALRKTNFVQTRAAELLGISRRILKYKMDKLGITEDLEKEGTAPESQVEAAPISEVSE
jgi:DNA-binding NtrC family response regulator